MRQSTAALVLVLALGALPAYGAVKTCTAARVTSTDCPSTAYTLLAFAVLTTELVEAADEIADFYGYPMIVCLQADVDGGRCSAGQLGKTVTTSETKNAFANRKAAEWLMRFVSQRRRRLAATSAESGTATPTPIQ